jgi:predicted GH43/DUF377 family glycosyl hydrolase
MRKASRTPTTDSEHIETGTSGTTTTNMHGPMKFHDEKLRADARRVVVRPFELAWQAHQSEPARALLLVEDIGRLSSSDASAELTQILAEFGERHWQIERVFERRFLHVIANLGFDEANFQDPHRKLIGAYFCHEYSYAAAALMNPSIVPHPDQSMLEPGSVRFVMSMRAVGEGHISSVAFREGILALGPKLSLWPTSGPALAAEQVPYCGTAAGGVSVTRNSDSTIGNCVIFPVTEAQRNGLEDLRLVRFTHEDGHVEWIGTYTAYSGLGIRSELMRTSDFGLFELTPLRGPAAANKGMALFPRKIGGKFAMIGRQDGKRLHLLYSDSLYEWPTIGSPLAGPKYSWELVQIGNCGSPIEINEGWLLLTHGVGAMRKYSIGAMLLDKSDPSLVLGRTRHPILMASEADRDGYVPNVVYTCGAVTIGDSLFMPYGFSDSGIGFASVDIRDLLEAMT